MSSLDSVTSSTSAQKPNVADAYFDKRIRIVTLYVEIILGLVGGTCVLGWLWYNRRRRSRVNAIIWNVTASDLLVICFASAMQLVWEYVDREWKAGDVMCRLLKWGQSFALMSSNNMLVVLSIDRHQAIRAPLKEPISVLKMASMGWGVAALLSLPQFAVFGQNYVTTEGPFLNKTVCESIFRNRPLSHRQAYLTFIGLVVFYIPLVIIVICYIRIFAKIARKTAEAAVCSDRSTSITSSSSSFRRNRSFGSRSARQKVHLQMSTKSKSLPRAKAKTLKMTVVIGASFIICGLPYHVYEMIASYGDHTIISGAAAALLGALACANSVTNPYVFLAFNMSAPCVRRIFQAFLKGKIGRTEVVERQMRRSDLRKEQCGSAGAICLHPTSEGVPTVSTGCIGGGGVGVLYAC